MTEKMTLGDFISRMNKGWGFRRPYRPAQIGAMLEQLIPEMLRENKVEIEFLNGHYGSGPNFHYTYEWRVRGVSVPELRPTKLAPSEVDRLFGCTSKMLPQLFLTADGFYVRYEW